MAEAALKLADDEDDPRAAVTALVLAAECPRPELRKELEGLKVSVRAFALCSRCLRG